MYDSLGKVPLTITAFFLAVAIVLAFGYGLSAWRDYMGNPIVLVAEVLAKEHRQTTDNSNAEPVHQYYVKLDISEAFQLTEAGISDALPRYRGQKTLPTQERLYLNLQEHEVATLLCTPAGVPFAYLDDWMTEEYEKEA
ncbi:MAG: hypothetical protein HC893_09200 [Chloroflexaceae bacterium]|nr:hypothetical protein [Chloroflexaceae bacterium]